MNILGINIQFEWLNLALAIILFALAAPAMIYFSRRKNHAPKIRFSTLRNISPTKRPLKVRLRNLPLWLRLLALALLLVAFAHPYQEKELKRHEPQNNRQESQSKPKEERKIIKVPSEGISIQLLIDRSSSMGIQRDRFGRNYNFMRFEGTLLSKLDVVRIISKRFIKGTKKTAELRKEATPFSGRGNDLISLTTFARYPLIACPLTLRHELLLDYISQLESVKRRQEDGTYIGYALERAILQVVDAKSRAKENDAYHIKSSIIVLVTDGQQSIRPEDQDDRHKAILPSEAAQLAKENGVKIYTIAVAPRLIYDEDGTVLGSANQFSTSEIQKAAELTGGKFYLAEDGDTLLKIYQDINTLEKSKLPVKKELEARVEKSRENKLIKTEKVEYFPFFLWAGLIVYLLELLLSIFYFRRIP